MQRLILAGAGLLAIVVAGTAQAAMPVVDVRAIAQAIQQVREMQRQLAVAQQQFTQLQQTYAAIAHLPQAATNSINTTLDPFRNPLPAPGSTDTMMGGGLLGSAAGAYHQRNNVYSPTGRDFQAVEMGRKANGIANALAMANQLFSASSGRINALRVIEGQLATARDPKDVQDLSARIQAEQAYIAAAQVQAQSLSLLAATEQRSEQQRQTEMRRRSIDTLINAAVARGG